MAKHLNRLMRPSRCSMSTGLDGRFQCTIFLAYQWKSNPSWPTEVVESTNGRKGELNALRILLVRATALSVMVLSIKGIAK